MDPPQFTPAVTRVYQVVRKKRAVLAIADATTWLVLPTIVNVEI